MYTTLNKIRAHSPCGMNPREAPRTGFLKLRAYLGTGYDPDAPLRILTILDSNGLGDALWCLCAVTGHDREIRLLGVNYARRVQHLMTDQSSLDALDVAERFANGLATAEELAQAASAADAAVAAAEAASAAWWAARAAAWAAARAAAARTAAWAADAARAARAAERAYQEQALRGLCMRVEDVRMGGV